MRFVTRKEIEYLGSVDGHVTESAELIDEMCQRLDALRRYDQNFSDSDWHPHALRGGLAIRIFAECAKD